MKPCLSSFLRAVAKIVAQVSKPAVSPISKSAGRATSRGQRVWKPAIQQTWKSALHFESAEFVIL